jgi:4-amino-4-deoxy-L-arabinose transferase-like glycosyltransferase
MIETVQPSKKPMLVDNPTRNAMGAGGLPRWFWTLGLLAVASFAVRVAALKYWGTGTISADGVEYASIAENLRKGIGYVSIMTPGRELNLPPLFPLLIAVASFVTSSYSNAGRLVSFVFGTLLPLPVFGIALRLFNRRTAWVAAALTILHPLLVNLSFTVWSEGPYMTLLLTAVYLVLRALERSTTWIWALSGLIFGLAYLIRPEAVATMLLAVVFGLAATEGSLAIRGKRVIVALAVFAALVAPEVVYLYRSTGAVRLEAKSAILYYLSSRVFAAQASIEGNHTSTDAYDQMSSLPDEESWEPWPVKWASNAINANLEPTGVWMRPNADVVRETRPNPKLLAQIVRTAVRQNAPQFLEALSSKWLGAPFLPALALLGAVWRPWRQPLASSYLFVTLVPALAIVATFSNIFHYPRFYFVLVPFLLIWAANGLVQVGQWAKTSTAAARGWLNPAAAAWIVPGLLALGAIIYPVRAVRGLYEFFSDSSYTLIDKQVGMWIRQQQDGPVRIMDLQLNIAFAADEQFANFPYCSSDLALRFLDSAKVDYVVLRPHEKFTRYYQDWAANGIPDPRAKLVYMSSGATTDKILVYRWNRADTISASR